MNVDTAGATMSLEDATIRCEGLDNLEIKHRLNHIRGVYEPYLGLEVGTGNIEISGLSDGLMKVLVGAFNVSEQVDDFIQSGEGE